MRKIGVAERRARLARRHHLAPGARSGDVVEVAHDLLGLHATDPTSVFLAARARMRNARVEAIEDALYEQRTLARMIGMRRTLFVLPAGIAPVVEAACTKAIAARERRRLIGMIEQGGIAKDGRRWLAAAERAVMAALSEMGEASGAELGRAVPQLRAQLMLGEGKKWGGPQSVTTFVLSRMSMDGKIVRGRPRGSWISSQYRWAPAESWLSEQAEEWEPAAARAELVRRWLRAFGPGTVADIKWWTGLTLGEVKKALAGVDTVEVDLGGETGLVLADDTAPVRAPKPWAALLPALDPTAMGWAGRDWYLGDHRSAVFDRAGNVGPTVWWDGRIVGGWTQRPGGEIAFRVLDDIGAVALAAVEAEAARLQIWLGEVRFKPRFRTPLDLALGD
jgi:hypothetical protein